MKEYYERRYVQFNDLVFDSKDMVSGDASPASFRSTGYAYSRRYGDYSPLMGEYAIPASRNESMTITLIMSKLPCEVRKYYKRFARTQLTKNGKLWAVDGDTLIWAYASITNLTEVSLDRRDRVEFDVEFYLPEGVWHKADKMRTYLLPYDLCEFMDCYKYKDVDPCFHGDCCNCSDDSCGDCDCCDCDIEKSMALCYQKDRIQDFYKDCGAGLRIVYDCDAAQRYFGNNQKEYLGYKFCDNCGLITGILYSDTDIPTDGIKIRIKGKVSNVYIEINGNGNVILGDHEDITIHEDGSITDDCGDTLSVELWQKPQGMDYGWWINPGNNRVMIQPGNCCGVVCAYIEVDSLTI